MKKIVFLSLFALCLPWALSAQSVDDDLYYVPSKKKEEKTEKKKTPAADAVVVKTNAPTTVYASPGNTTIVVKDRKGNIRDVDEYNRRYDSKDYDFSQENDTLYIDEKEDDGLDGEWVNGFDGSEDDYEYAHYPFPQSTLCHQYQQPALLGCSLWSESMGLECIYGRIVRICISYLHQPFVVGLAL